MERLDANGDGRLQFSEFRAWYVEKHAEAAAKAEKSMTALRLEDNDGTAADDEERHVPLKICIDKNDNILLLDVGTNCIEVGREGFAAFVWVPP